MTLICYDFVTSQVTNFLKFCNGNEITIIVIGLQVHRTHSLHSCIHVCIVCNLVSLFSCKLHILLEFNQLLANVRGKKYT